MKHLLRNALFLGTTAFVATLLICQLIVPAIFNRGATGIAIGSGVLFVALATVNEIRRWRGKSYKPTTRARLRIVVPMAAAVCGYSLARLSGFVEAPFQRMQCESIVRMIEGGKLAETSPGIVELPPELAGVAVNGTVCVTHFTKGAAYLFKTANSLHAGRFRGYVYLTVPFGALGPDDYGDVSIVGWVETRPPLDKPRKAVPVEVMARPTEWPSWFWVASAD